MSHERNRNRRRRAGVLNPTQRADLGWEMLQAYRHEDKTLRPSWEEHKRRFFKLKGLQIIDLK
jgi:hypothetical protein